MKTNQSNESKISKLKINDAFSTEEGQVLDVDGLMKVEGGVDNDEDWCAVQECAVAAKSCYTGA